MQMANDKMIRSLARDLASLIAQIDQRATGNNDELIEPIKDPGVDKKGHFKKTDKKD